MRLSKRVMLFGASGIAVLSLASAAFAVAQPHAAHAAAGGISGETRTISKGGTSSFAAAAEATDMAVQDPEFANEAGSDAAGGNAGTGDFTGVDRSHTGATKGNGRTVNASAQAKSNPELNLSFDGLNFRQQRLANGGNQFSVEPPDQGMCAGNGFIVETVNDVFRVFHTDGTPATGVVDLNS
jgi:hypothetical protein